jgi:hypothetical protein
MIRMRVIIDFLTIKNQERKFTASDFYVQGMRPRSTYALPQG